MPKMTVNPTALVIGVGCGWCPLILRAADAVHRSVNVDDLVDILPGILRRESVALAARRVDPETFLGNRYALVGLSAKFGRMVGYLFEAEMFFEPVSAATFSTPEAFDLLAMDAQSLDDVTGVAVQQIATLGLATGGSVIGATLTHDGITTRTLLKLPKLEIAA
jgi:hypothetical protein